MRERRGRGRRHVRARLAGGCPVETDAAKHVHEMGEREAENGEQADRWFGMWFVRWSSTHQFDRGARAEEATKTQSEARL